MDPQQQFCLKWNSFGSNLASAFGNLFKSESLTDVTLFCEGVTFKAHKLILAACSKHFQDLFETAPLCPSGILVILDGTSSSNMSALLEFMYKGEVHVSQESLSSFLKAAECLQVKGLSIEHEKLAVVQGQQQMVSHDTQLDSPTSRKQPKLNSNGSVSKDTLLDGATSGSEPLLQHHAPSTSSYSPVMSGYGMHPPLYRPAYEQRVPPSGPPPASLYDAGLPRKRQHRSSSDAPDTRPSVLRDGSKAAEKHSPMSLAYRPNVKQGEGPVRFDGGPDTRDNTAAAASNSAASAATTANFDRTAAVDGDGNKSASENRRSSVDPGSSCPEDLRVKLELSSHPEEQHMSQAALSYTEASVDKTPEIPANIWNSGTKLKGGSVTTSDGKKLQCPFCERLYGYETNLRAHIRQRHQGIRVHCPFCSRTFTRNNTVRRHIAREHKSEYSVKSFQQGQVLNHNNQ